MDGKRGKASKDKDEGEGVEIAEAMEEHVSTSAGQVLPLGLCARSCDGDKFTRQTWLGM